MGEGIAQSVLKARFSCDRDHAPKAKAELHLVRFQSLWKLA